MLIIKAYAFEEGYMHKTRVDVKRGEDGRLHRGSEQDTGDSLMNYVLTDIHAKECLKFDLSSPPVLLEKISISDKRKLGGFSFQDEMYPQFRQQIRNFHFVGDSVIGKYKYAILEDTISFQIDHFFYRKARAFLNKDLDGMKVHLLSTGLDHLFNGIVTRLELYDNNGQSVVMEWSIADVNEKEIDLAEKYMSFYEGIKKPTMQ
ncbi:MAG: hypothetical protein J7623_12250 [Chitinophaga sp.]|nr:hypothetical protein [Chitinophaga sp.]